MRVIENIQIVHLFEGHEALVNRAIRLADLVEGQAQMFGKELVSAEALRDSIIVFSSGEMQVLDLCPRLLKGNVRQVVALG